MTMRPKLLDDVRYVKRPDGVYVHGFGGACTLKGDHTYDWLDRLAPHLTGERTLDELVGPLGAEQRAMVTDLVSALSAQRLVIDAADEQPHRLDDEELRVYAAEIAFIRYQLDSAPARFDRVRAARINLLGQGPVLAALLAAGLRSGWRHVNVLAPVEEAAGLRDVAEEARRDPKQTVRFVADLADADVVLQVGAEHDRAELIAVSRACAAAGTAVGQVLLGAEEAWLTSVGAAEAVEAESCWRRLRPPPSIAGSPGPDWLTGPVPDILAAQLALSCFSYLTGLDTLPPAEGAPRPPVLTRVDLATLVTTTHQVRPHPLASLAPTSDHEPDVRALVGGAPVDGGELLKRAPAYVDRRTGLLGLLGEEDLPQIPLSTCRARVADPHGVLPGPAPAPTVVGWGHDRTSARRHTLLAALATYGSLSMGSLPPQGHVPGLDLVTGQPRAVSAVLAYPAQGDARLPYTAPVGAAAGLSWAAAVAAGLRAHCEALLAAHPGHAEHGRPALDIAEAVGDVDDEQAGYLRRLLVAADRRVTAVDLSDVLGLPAFAFHGDTDSTVVSCAPTVAGALRDGLECMVLRWQVRVEGGPDAQLAWAEHLRPVEPATAVPEVFVDALRQAGHSPVAVPIARDRQARELMPYVVQVVLCDE